MASLSVSPHLRTFVSMFNAISTVRHIIRPILRRDAPQYASTISLFVCIALAIISLVIGLSQRSLIVQTSCDHFSESA